MLLDASQELEALQEATILQMLKRPHNAQVNLGDVTLFRRMRTVDNSFDINGRPIQIPGVCFVSDQETDSRLQETYLVKGGNHMK